jgi:hypothetical protein
MGIAGRGKQERQKPTEAVEKSRSLHPTSPLLVSRRQGPVRASRAVAAAKAERPLWVRKRSSAADD